MQKVMVVEDDEDILFIVSFLLEEKGMQVMPLSQCKQAVDAAVNWKPDLILLDINLGLCDGRQLCYELKTVHHFAAPVLLFSANPELATAGSYCMADGFIQKPFDTEDLVSTIQHHLLTT